MIAEGNEFTQEVTRWAAVIGQWDLNSAGKSTYRCPQAGSRPYGLCVSNVRFSEGAIEFELQQPEGLVDGRVVIGYKSLADEYLAIGLGGYGDAYSITHFDSIAGWKKLAGAGKNEDLSNHKKYQAIVRVVGRNLKLEVDGVQVLECDLDSELPFGQVGLFAWGDTGGAEFSNVTVTRQPSDIEHVVILVHGIRTHGEWQQILRREFSQVGIVLAPTNYGYIDVVRFLLPVPWFRKSAIEKVSDLVRSVKLNYPKARISFLAHSFGTYVVANMLTKEFDFKAHRLVFCGSVVRYSFSFEGIRGRFTPPLVNEVSARDPWPAIAENATFGYGAVGTRGFNNSQVTDRWHLGFGHSQYLTETFCKTFWIPFFDTGKVVPGASVREKAPWWCRCLRVFTNKYAWALVLFGLFLSWPYLWAAPEPIIANQTFCDQQRALGVKAWRAKYLLGDNPDTYYVIVESIDRFRQISSLNSALAHLESYRLERQFPEVGFDAMLTSRPDGTNRMYAIMLARGIDKKTACEIRKFANTCGVSTNAYVYRLGRGPEGCEEFQF
jgi:hypothetical protein